MGPILFSYCQWIHDQFEKLNGNVDENPATIQKRLWFAARDMYLFKEVYETIYEMEQAPDYMYISRKSLRPILTVSTGDITESGNAFPRGECTLAEIVKRMGYSLEDIDSDVDLDIKVNPRNLSDSVEARKAFLSGKIIIH